MFNFRWLSSVDSRPGFSEQVFKMLQDKVKSFPDAYQKCCIIIDGMAIRKHIGYDAAHREDVGYVDLGPNLSESSEDEATEALVIMAVGIRGHWKIPLGYFLINGISSELQCNLIKTSVEKLYDVGIQVLCLTMDGHTTNQAMVANLGGKLSVPFKPWFVHPCNENLRVYILFDACHLLKNVRGAIFAYKSIQHPDIGVCEWQYLCKLQKLQEDEGLHAANKLTKKHVSFQNNKMRVKLAAQTLSASVAKALEYVHNIDICGFEQCLGTAKFISMIDRLFDIFNSKSPFGKGYKGPIRLSNIENTRKFLEETRNVLLTATQSNNQKVCEGKRKIAFIGFAFNIQILLGLSDYMLTQIQPSFKYVLTYKFSQDHLEIFFSNIRHCGGWNNNPSALQFRSAYRSLLCHAGIEICDSDYKASNCVPMDDTSLISVQDETAIRTTSVTHGVTFEQALFDHVYSEQTVTALSEFSLGILEYIGGFLIRSLLKKVSCKECLQGLLKPVNQIQSVESFSSKSLIQLKNNGGLKVPSDDVLKIPKHSEIVIRSTVNIKQLKMIETKI